MYHLKQTVEAKSNKTEKIQIQQHKNSQFTFCKMRVKNAWRHKKGSLDVTREVRH